MIKTEDSEPFLFSDVSFWPDKVLDLALSDEPVFGDFDGGEVSLSSSEDSF